MKNIIKNGQMKNFSIFFFVKKLLLMLFDFFKSADQPDKKIIFVCKVNSIKEEESPIIFL